MFAWYVQLGNLRLNLGLELVRGAFELVHRLPDLASNLRQFFGPENDEGDDENKGHLWKTEVQSAMILPEPIGSNPPPSLVPHLCVVIAM